MYIEMFAILPLGTLALFGSMSDSLKIKWFWTIVGESLMIHQYVCFVLYAIKVSS